DSNYITSTGTLSAFTVSKGNTTTTVTALPSSGSTFGQAVTFTATVTPSVGAVQPTGSGRFYNGSVPAANLLGTGTLANVSGTATATYTTSPTTELSAGSHTIIGVYSAAADPNFLDSTSGGLPYSVNQAPTTTTITQATPAPSTFGQQ